MNDHERATEALEQLQEIDPAGAPDLASQHARAIEAVEELQAALESDQQTTEDDHEPTPDEWDDEDEWQERLEDAYDEAGIAPSKGTLTTKTIDGRDYYYLQWREGDTVTSQYVAPVDPA